MRFERLDLNLLVALDALLDERNVSAAAERLCLSQSAMSGALGRLRDFFGDELLVNTGRKMVLTPRGEALAEPVRGVLLQIKSTITTKPSFDPATSDRKFTVTASDYALAVMLSGALQAISQQAPDITVELVQLDDRPGEHLERREIDLLITLDHALSENHPKSRFFEDDYVVVAWSGNTEIKEKLDRTLYFGLGHVSVQFGKARLPAFEEYFLQTQQVRRRIEIVAPSFTAVPGLVVGTNRIATVQRRLAEQAAKHLPLVIHESPVDIPPIRQSIQWHRSSSQDLALRWLIEQLKRHAGHPSLERPALALAEDEIAGA
ncbi:transcriptional regulator [Caulobacter sp. D4A]|uniref:LysR family transcriptional regulator n=1 Tax=unclassified Caulobacter TaxID=2648921 RepID=UPI000D729193|nr:MULTISPECIES: LysR family transcriptional regulator [unclassified Caulobacter]PXA88840.1 transcriptional regulator [Caulobacter sp. D4A]PXA94118.1 transcriptional regulator [Caulobacter sp. D5]